MNGPGDIILNILLFLSVYAQVFFLVTFLENRKKIRVRKGEIKLSRYPTVTIAVPCWNEEKTVYKTVRSLLNLNYPKDKLKIFLVDDGSEDGTLGVIKKFAHYPNIQIFHKPNGGKHTALNLALEKSSAEFFGCLDADSVADREALVRIMSYFENDPEVMAVAPSVTVHEPKNFIQYAQKAEYLMGVYLKKMLGFLGAINVTPGPLTVFRKKVFDDLGPYREAHSTEDMEIAYRMQIARYKIEHCNDAHVYTNTPHTIYKLYRQRLRWIYGFINNTIDYRRAIFRKKYGHFAMFTLPVGLLTIVSAGYLFVNLVYNLFDFISSKILEVRTIGWNFGWGEWQFDPFFIRTDSFVFLLLGIYALVLFTMFYGGKIAQAKASFSWGMLYYFPLFGLIAPFWLLKAIYNTVVARKPSWR